MCKKRYAITASAFDVKGRLICTKSNSYSKTHPLQKHFAKIAGEPYKESLHAEIACLVAAKGTPVAKIVILRYDCNANMKLALPCKTCMAALKAYNVKEIYYSTEEGLRNYDRSTCW